MRVASFTAARVKLWVGRADGVLVVVCMTVSVGGSSGGGMAETGWKDVRGGNELEKGSTCARSTCERA